MRRIAFRKLLSYSIIFTVKLFSFLYQLGDITFSIQAFLAVSWRNNSFYPLNFYQPIKFSRTYIKQSHSLFCRYEPTVLSQIIHDGLRFYFEYTVQFKECQTIAMINRIDTIERIVYNPINLIIVRTKIMNFELWRAVTAYRGELTPSEHHMLLALVGYARADNPLADIYPGIEQMMTITRMSRGTVIRVQKSLVKKNLIKYDGYHGHTKIIRFVPDVLGFSTEKLPHKTKQKELPRPAPPEQEAPVRDAPPPAGERDTTDWMPGEPGALKRRKQELHERSIAAMQRLGAIT